MDHTVEITEVTALQVQHAQTAAGRNCCFQDTNPGLPLIRPLVAVVVLGVVQIGRYEHLRVRGLSIMRCIRRNNKNCCMRQV